MKILMPVLVLTRGPERVVLAGKSYVGSACPSCGGFRHDYKPEYDVKYLLKSEH